MSDTRGDGQDPVARLQRWETYGATWQVLARTGQDITVSLCRCDGGEEVERLSSADPALAEFIAGRWSSEE